MSKMGDGANRPKKLKIKVNEKVELKCERLVMFVLNDIVGFVRSRKGIEIRR